MVPKVIIFILTLNEGITIFQKKKKVANVMLFLWSLFPYCACVHWHFIVGMYKKCLTLN